MISIEPAQARLVRAWVLQCLNLTDQSVAEVPAPFSEDTVRWAPTDWPRPGDLYAMLREVSLVEIGPPEKQRESVDVGLPTEDLLEYSRTISEWTIAVQVVSRLSDSSPDIARSAGRYLRRITHRVLDETGNDMRAAGVAWRRSSQILPLHRIARGSQWETRAAVDLTFCVGEYIVGRPGWIDSMSGTGTLSPLAPEAFSADHEDDPADLL